MLFKSKNLLLKNSKKFFAKQHHLTHEDHDHHSTDWSVKELAKTNEPIIKLNNPYFNILGINS